MSNEETKKIEIVMPEIPLAPVRDTFIKKCMRNIDDDTHTCPYCNLPITMVLGLFGGVRPDRTHFMMCTSIDMLWTRRLEEYQKQHENWLEQSESIRRIIALQQITNVNN